METQTQPQTAHTTIVVVSKPKSTGVAFLLAFLFGPLGLLYASIAGGIIMFFIALLSFFILPVIGAVLVWIGCIIWAIVAAQNANSKAVSGVTINHLAAAR
jgi:hypothetical protein